MLSMLATLSVLRRIDRNDSRSRCAIVQPLERDALQDHVCPTSRGPCVPTRLNGLWLRAEKAGRARIRPTCDCPSGYISAKLGGIAGLAGPANRDTHEPATESLRSVARSARLWPVMHW